MSEGFEKRKTVRHARQLVRFQRGKFYASILQFMLILVLTVRTFNTQKLIGIPSFTATILAFILGGIGVWFIGYLDDKLGIFSGFMRYRTRLNPKWKQLFERLDELEEKIE